MRTVLLLILLALTSGCSCKTAQREKDVWSERKFWSEWVLKARSGEAVGQLSYVKLGIKSDCDDQNSIELRGIADEKAATQLIKIMSGLAPDHLVTVVARSEHLAYVETTVNCGEEWMPGGLYAVFNFVQVRTPGEKRWQVLTVSRWSE